MNSWQAWLHSWKWNIRHIKIWLWIYGINLLLALLVSLPLFDALENILGKAVVSDWLMKGFNYVVLTDLLNHYGELFLPVIAQSGWIIMLYFFIGIGYNGGVLSFISHPKKTVHISQFLVGSSHYFGRLLILAIVFLIIHGLFVAGIFLLFKWSAYDFDLKKMSSELVLYQMAVAWGGIYGIVLLFLFLWQAIAKILIGTRGWTVFKAVIEAISVLKNHFLSFLGFAILYWLTLFFIIFIIQKIAPSYLNSTTLTVWLSLLLSQIFVFVRIGLSWIYLKGVHLILEKK